MNFLSSIFRFIHRSYLGTLNFFRILKLRVLYPGVSIDFASTIEPNCLIKCIKGGKLVVKNCSISAGTQIVVDTAGSLFMEDAFIGRNCVITSKESIIIKKGCLIAEMVVIRDQDHQVAANGGVFSREEFVTAPVIIEENVWVAAKATILKGVSIGRNAVVAASAVITGNVPANEVWGGIPGKFLKNISAATKE